VPVYHNHTAPCNYPQPKQMRRLIERYRILVMGNDGMLAFAQEGRAPYTPIAFDSEAEAYEHIASQQYSRGESREQTIIKTWQWT
jgi:hypothetical protein